MRHRKRKKAAAFAMVMAIVVVAALAALIVLTFSNVLIVQDIMVVGNRNLLREEVITQSGVQKGDALLSVTSARLRERLEKNRYIEYVGHDFDYRGRLTIRINERLGMAVVNVLGLYYVLDSTGMVLECAGSEYPLDVAGPRVTGLLLDDNTRVLVGETLPVRDVGQLEGMRSVIAELDETNLLGRASQLDLQNLENIYIMTSDSAKVELGNTTGLRTKLLIAREVLFLREKEGDLQGAKIDVSNGENAHFIPAVLPSPTSVPTASPTVGPDTTPEA